MDGWATYGHGSAKRGPSFRIARAMQPALPMPTCGTIHGRCWASPPRWARWWRSCWRRDAEDRAFARTGDCCPVRGAFIAPTVTLVTADYETDKRLREPASVQR